MTNQTYEVVVVGGGAAGLSGAMALGRSRRSVLVLDAGEPRNAIANGAHNYLGREGINPLKLLEIGRAEVAAYGVEVLGERVVGLSGEKDSFVVTTEGGRQVTARRVLVTAGVVDDLPDVPGLAGRWGVDVLHCPYCHGWEVRDQRIAVLGTTPMAGHQGLLFRQLSDDVVLVLHDGVELPDAELEKMSAIGVRIVAGTPREVLTEGDALVGLRLADGSVLERDAIVVASKPRARADFLAPLGIEPKPFEMNGVAFGSVIEIDPSGATNVTGIFAAGNATDISMTLLASAAHGNRVGAWINAELATEDAIRAVAERRAQQFERPAWEERYCGEKVWSGQVNVQLQAEIADMAPGRALDVGCGEGADALWLAARGWDVTAVDFADAALARVAEHAAEVGVADRVKTRRIDVRTFEPDGQTWDLVTAHFVHLPDGGMLDVTRRLGSAVAPGGTLLVVGHDPGDLATGLRHGHQSFMHTADELLPALGDGWEVEACESRPRTQAHPQTGEDIAIADTVLRARLKG